MGDFTTDGVHQLGHVPKDQPKRAGETQYEAVQRKRDVRAAELKRLVDEAPTDPDGAAITLLSRTDVVNAALVMSAAKSMGRDGEAILRLAESVLAAASRDAAPLLAAIDIAHRARAEAARKSKEAEAKNAEADKAAADAKRLTDQASAKKAEADRLTADAAALTMQAKPQHDATPVTPPAPKAGKK